LSWRKPEAKPADVSADHGVAAGGDIRDSRITVGLDEEGVRRVLQEELARIAGEKGISPAPLQAVLAKLGEAGVPDHDIVARLDAAADQLIELRAQLARLSNDRPELAVIRQQALALIDAGDLDGARAALSRGREVARTLRAEASRNEAEFLADEARIDHLQLAYRAAAAKYAEAAALVASFDRAGRWTFLVQQASELEDYGTELGDNQALTEAIAAYGRALVLAPRKNLPLDWASTQNNLGNVLATLGEREGGTAHLEEAVTAFRDALKEFTRERAPLQWAMTEKNLDATEELLAARRK
jgi:tetratricopeptide (TPR) repeat protein